MDELIGEENIKMYEVRRTLLDKILGRNKDIDSIIKVRKQINKIDSAFNRANLYRQVVTTNSSSLIYNYPDIYSKYFELTKLSINESLMYNQFGGAVLLKRLIVKRDNLIELLTNVIDISDIKKEIREDKLKSIGIL